MSGFANDGFSICLIQAKPLTGHQAREGVQDLAVEFALAWFFAKYVTPGPRSPPSLSASVLSDVSVTGEMGWSLRLFPEGILARSCKVSFMT